MRPLAGRTVTADPAIGPAARCARWLEALGAGVTEGRGVELDLDGVRVALPGAGEDPLALACRTGIYDRPIGPARWHPLDVAGCVAAAWAAIGLLAATFDQERGGPERRGEVPLVDAAVSASELSALLVDRPPAGWEPIRWAASPWVGAWRCADGRWLQLHAGLPSHLARLVAHPLVEGALDGVVGPATAADPLAVDTPWDALRQRRALRALFRRHPAARWEAELGTAGLCAVVCRTGDELRALVGEVPALRVDPLETAIRPVAAASGGPLAGVRVVDLTQVIAGPVAGRALASLGAEVVKGVDPRARQGWVEAFRSAFDAGKRVIPLDLRTERAALAELLRDADVVLHGFRPSATERLGVDDASIRAVAPRAIVGVVSAYGPTGPLGGWPGWEQTAQALAGTQLDYGGGRPDLVPLPATDLCTGLSLAAGVLAALVGGRAARVEATLLGAALELRRDAPDRAPVRRATLRRILALRPGQVRRVERPRLGEITELAVPLRMPGVQPFPEPGPGATVDRPPRSRVGTAWWGAALAAGRIGG